MIDVKETYKEGYKDNMKKKLYGLLREREKDGYIERYYVESPNDKVDLTIQDMQRYTRTLIEEETNISTMVEKALRENAKEDEEDAKNNESDIIDEADLSIEDLEKTLRDEDYTDFEDFKDELAQEDAKFLESL